MIIVFYIILSVKFVKLIVHIVFTNVLMKIDVVEEYFIDIDSYIVVKPVIAFIKLVNRAIFDIVIEVSITIIIMFRV